VRLHSITTQNIFGFGRVAASIEVLITHHAVLPHSMAHGCNVENAVFDNKSV
jgi:hypothetical protein